MLFSAEVKSIHLFDSFTNELKDNILKSQLTRYIDYKQLKIKIMKKLPIPYAIIIGSIFISLSLYFGHSVNRYSHTEGKQILDKKEGVIYLLDEKKYILKNGDVYQYE